MTGSGRRLGAWFWVAVAWVALVALAAALAPWLPLKDPDASFIDRAAGRPPYPPGAAHWFGTDQDARDVFSRTVFGARVSLVVGFVAIACGMVFGGALGIVAGHFRGAVDRMVSFVLVTILSFPALVLAILITSLVDRGLLTISLVLGFLAIAPVGQLARSATVQYSERNFVLAARTMGATDWHIIRRELLPNVVIPMSALGLLGMAVAIVAEGALAFLGLSVQKQETWGKLILLGSGTRELEESPWVSLAPAFVLFLTVLALNYAGDAIRAKYDVRDVRL